jgi:ribonuclease BN (tRNA processing enzyme)
MLKFIGRGSCFNSKEGNNSAYIKKGESFLLIDCGCLTANKIIESNLLDGVKKVHILITHFHDDHVGSLGSLLLYCRYALDIIPDIYFEDKQYLVDFLAMQGLLEHEVYTYMTNRYVDDMKLTYSPVPTKHYEFYKPIQETVYSSEITKTVVMTNYFKCYGYYLVKNNIERTNQHAYYSGDSNSIPKNMLDILEFYDSAILYQDVCLSDEHGYAHLPLSKLCELIPKELRHKVYCMHLNSDELITKCKEEGFNVVEVEV